MFVETGKQLSDLSTVQKCRLWSTTDVKASHWIAGLVESVILPGFVITYSTNTVITVAVQVYLCIQSTILKDYYKNKPAATSYKTKEPHQGYSGYRHTTWRPQDLWLVSLGRMHFQHQWRLLIVRKTWSRCWEGSVICLFSHLAMPSPLQAICSRGSWKFSIWKDVNMAIAWQ